MLRGVALSLAALLAALAATGPSSGAGKDCGPVQETGTPNDGILYLEGVGGKYTRVGRDASLQQAGERVSFLYVISRDHPEHLHGGAVMVRTERFSSSQVPFSKVLLYRNEVPRGLRTWILPNKYMGYTPH